jgi:hypothetical protein
MLITRAGTAGQIASPSPFTITVKRRLDPDDVGAAAVAVEALREEAATLQTRLRASPGGRRRRHAHDLCDALRGVDDTAQDTCAAPGSRCAREPAEQPAAERRRADRRQLGGDELVELGSAPCVGGVRDGRRGLAVAAQRLGRRAFELLRPDDAGLRREAAAGRSTSTTDDGDLAAAGC